MTHNEATSTPGGLRDDDREDPQVLSLVEYFENFGTIAEMRPTLLAVRDEMYADLLAARPNKGRWYGLGARIARAVGILESGAYSMRRDARRRRRDGKAPTDAQVKAAQAAMRAAVTAWNETLAQAEKSA